MPHADDQPDKAEVDRRVLKSMGAQSNVDPDDLRVDPSKHVQQGGR